MTKYIAIMIVLVSFGTMYGQVKINTADSNIIARIQADCSNKIDSTNDQKSENLNLELEETWDIAKNELYRLYGKRTIKKEMPYRWFSYSKYYYFTGTFNEKKWPWIKSQVGGTFVLLINKENGTIVCVGHTK